MVEPLVGHIDLLPTLAESLGLGVVGTQGLYHGRSLWPLVRGEPGPDARALFAQRRPAESASDEEWADVYVLQTAHHKVILRSPSRAESSAGQEEFFDLVRDPKELAPLEAESDALSVLRTGLGERLRAYNALDGSDPESTPSITVFMSVACGAGSSGEPNVNARPSKSTVPAIAQHANAAPALPR